MEEFWIKRYESGVGNKKVLLIFPHWKARILPYKLLAKYFSDFHTIIYHTPSSLLSPDLEFTISNFRLLESVVFGDIDFLKSNGLSSFNTYGASLGTIMAIRIANILAGGGGCLDKVVLNLSCASFPFAVWNGDLTRDVRKKLEEKNVDYNILETAWDYLSPARNLFNLKNAKIFFFANLNDGAFTPPNVKRLIKEVKNFPNHKIKRGYFFGHRLGVIKNFLSLRATRKFLEKK